MRRIALLSCLALVICSLPVTSQAGPDLVVSELLADPAGDREFVEIWNRGDASAPLAGWSVRDAANQTYTFGNLTLAAGARIVVWGGGSDDATGPAWSKGSVWNNGGDTAFLLAPDGTVVDAFTYTSSAPGRSWALVDDAWVDAAPSPGAPTGAEGGQAVATVADVPPVITLDVPDHVRGGAPFAVSFSVTEDNGQDVTWNVTAAGSLVEAGNGTGTRTVTLTAPPEGDVTVVVAASDGSQSATASATVDVRAADLAVHLDAPLAFPTLAPGDRNVTSLAAFTIENLADASRVPHLDVSPFRFEAHEIAVDGNLLVGVDNGTGLVWVPYDGPLTPLPELAAGQSVDVWLRIVAVPTPLMPGPYGTSFTVVA